MFASGIANEDRRVDSVGFKPASILCLTCTNVLLIYQCQKTEYSRLGLSQVADGFVNNNELSVYITIGEFIEFLNGQCLIETESTRCSFLQMDVQKNWNA